MPADLLGGPVQDGNGVVPVQDDQAGADRAHDDLSERLEVPQVVALQLQFFAGGPEALGQPGGHDGHHEQRARVEEHGEHVEHGGFVEGSSRSRVGNTVRPNTNPVYSRLPEAATARAPARGSSNEAAMTDST